MATIRMCETMTFAKYVEVPDDVCAEGACAIVKWIRDRQEEPGDAYQFSWEDWCDSEAMEVYEVD